MTTLPHADRALLMLAEIRRAMEEMVQSEAGTPRFERALRRVLACPDQRLVVASFVAMLHAHAAQIEPADGEPLDRREIARDIVATGYESLAQVIVALSLKELLATPVETACPDCGWAKHRRPDWCQTPDWHEDDCPEHDKEQT